MARDIMVRTRNITVRNGSDAVVYETPCQGRQLRNLAACPYAVAVDCEQSALSAYSIESMVESPLDGEVVSPLDGEPRLH